MSVMLCFNTVFWLLHIDLWILTLEKADLDKIYRGETNKLIVSSPESLLMALENLTSIGDTKESSNLTMNLSLSDQEFVSDNSDASKEQTNNPDYNENGLGESVVQSNHHYSR